MELDPDDVLVHVQVPESLSLSHIGSVPLSLLRDNEDEEWQDQVSVRGLKFRRSNAKLYCLWPETGKIKQRVSRSIIIHRDASSIQEVHTTDGSVDSRSGRAAPAVPVLVQANDDTTSHKRKHHDKNVNNKRRKK